MDEVEIDRTKQLKQEYLKSLLDFYKEVLEKIEKNADKHAFFLDQAILAISSGAIGIIFTFYKDIVDNESISVLATLLVSASFISFAIAISAVLKSFDLMNRWFPHQITDINAWYDKQVSAIDAIQADISLEQQGSAIKDLSKPYNFQGSWKKKIDRWNRTASISVLSGILCGIAFFMVVNFFPTLKVEINFQTPPPSSPAPLPIEPSAQSQAQTGL